MKDEEHEKKLITAVFDTKQGQELLAYLAQQYIWAPQFTDNPYKLAARVGAQELVTHLCNVVEEARNND